MKIIKKISIFLRPKNKIGKPHKECSGLNGKSLKHRIWSMKSLASYKSVICLTFTEFDTRVYIPYSDAANTNDSLNFGFSLTILTALLPPGELITLPLPSPAVCACPRIQILAFRFYFLNETGNLDLEFQVKKLPFTVKFNPFLKYHFECNLLHVKSFVRTSALEYFQLYHFSAVCPSSLSSCLASSSFFFLSKEQERKFPQTRRRNERLSILMMDLHIWARTQNSVSISICLGSKEEKLGFV